MRDREMESVMEWSVGRRLPPAGMVRPAALNRRRFLALAGSVAAGAILAACGGSNATDTPKPATTAAGTSTAPTAAAGASPATTGGATTVAGTSATGSAASSTQAVGSAASGASPTGTTAAASSVSGTGVSGTRAAGSAVSGTRPAGTSAAAAGSPVTGTPAAGSSVAGAGGRTLVIEASEYSFKTLGSIPAGVTTVQMKNVGKENHEVQFVRLNDGVTLDQFLAAIQQAGQGAPPPIFSFEGGPAENVPNGTSEVILDLQPGQYVLLCFVNSPDGQPHVAKGMFLDLKVDAATGPTGTLPTGKGTIALGSANGFDLPATLPAGKSQYRLTNQGKNPHAFFFGSIPADKTIDDVNAELAKPDAPPPPWFKASGGMDGLKPGGSGAVTLDLVAGKYVAVDVAFGDEKPSAKIFTVS